MTIQEFNRRFKTENGIIKHFITIRYPMGLGCSHCGCMDVHPRANRPRIYQCSGCGKDFSVFQGTIFQDSQTDLRKWFYAIHLILNSKKGISGLQLQREIGVTYKCAWRMLRQIRLAMGNKSYANTFDKVLEIDETYIGGKPRKGTKGTKDIPVKNKRGRGTDKMPVIGIKDRVKELIHAKVALPDEKGKKLTGLQLLEVLHQVAKQRKKGKHKTKVMTDTFRGYNILDNKENKKEFRRMKVDHTKEFVAGKDIHTNGMENFWSILKRGIYGIYHAVSVKHLQHYVDEFTFRYNNRKSKNMYDIILFQSVNLSIPSGDIIDESL